MDIQTKDGILLRGIPDGTPDDAIKARIAKIRGESSSAPDPSEGRLPLRPFGIDTGLTMPQGVSRAAAGAGKAISDWGQGIKQAGTEIFNPQAGTELRRQTDDQRALDAPLMKTGAGFAGNLGMNIAALAPTLAIPGANTYTGAALVGALSSALSPVGTDDNRAGNAALGAGAGVAGQAAGRALGRALRPVASKLGPEEQALAVAAGREGIPLTAGQATGSRPLQITESVMENLPMTSGSQIAGREAQQRAFTAAALRRAGIAGDSANAGALLTQKNALGSQIGGVAQRGSLDFGQGLEAQLAGIVKNAETHLPPSDAAKVAGTVKQILSGQSPAVPSQAVPSVILGQNGQPLMNMKAAVPGAPMEGTLYQGWREPLRSLASEGGATGRVYGDIRKALDTAFRDQIPVADKAAVETASRQYANVKTIIDAMGGAGNLPATGQVSPAQLSAALGRAMGREGKALGRGDLNELARVGQVFVRDKVPNSGTAQRQLIQSLLTTGGGAGLGATGAAATGHDPVSGAAYGLAAGGASLAAPKLFQSLMNSKAGQEYLKSGAVALTETQRAALSNALRIGAIGAAQ